MSIRKIGVLLVMMMLLVLSIVPAAAQDVVEIEFWSLLTGSLGERVEALVDDYNASQDAVQVTYVNQGGYTPLQQELLAAVAAGPEALPTVTLVDFIHVPFYAVNGVFEPLNNLVSEEDLADFTPGLLGDLTVDGQLYAIPFNRSTQGLYYNKDLFREAGLDPEMPPQTWDEVVEYSRAISALGDDTYGIYGHLSGAWYWQPFIQSWGGEFNDDQCNATFNDETGVAVAEFMKSMLDEGISTYPSNLSGTFDQQALEFVLGRVGMMRQSTAVNAFIGDNVDFEWGFTMFPEGPAGRSVTGGGANLAIIESASDDEKAAAWDFVNFMSSTENTARFHMETGYMPSRLSALESEEVQAFHEENPTWRVSVEQLAFAQPTSCTIYNVPEFWGVVQSNFDRILLEDEDPQMVLDDIVAEINMIVDEARQAGTLVTPMDMGR